MNKRLLTPKFFVAAIFLATGIFTVGRMGLPKEADSASIAAKKFAAPLEIESAFPGGVGLWSNTTAMPGPLMGHAAVNYNDRVYVIGGTNSNGIDTKKVWYASVNASGSLSGWTETASLPKAMSQHSSVAYNGRIYVIGGNSAGSGIADVYYALVNGDGTLGAWNVATSLPAFLQRHSSVANNGYVYVFAGNSTGGCCTSTVRYAPINADGTLGVWANTTSLFYGQEIPVVFYNGYVYAVGGSDGSLPVRNVRYALVNANGSIGTWNNTTLLPQAVASQVAFAHNGYLYSIGGEVATGGDTENIYYAPISPNGSVGSWNTSPNQLLRPLRDHAGLINNGYVYIFGGKAGPYAFPDVSYAPTL